MFRRAPLRARFARSPRHLLGVLACLTLALAVLASSPALAEEEVPADAEDAVVFTDDEAYDDGDTDAFRLYCVYTIGQVTGNCGAFGPGDRLCVNCPASGDCPLAASSIGNFRYVAADGTLICKGEWSRSFDPTQPDKCTTCVGGGQPGYKFVN